MRKYATSIILMLSMFACELHTVVPKSDKTERWIWRYDMSTTRRWNVKYAIGELWPIMVFAAWLLYRRNKINYTTILTVMVWLCLDAAMYFYNYKTAGYWKVYFWLVPLWVIMYLWKGRKQEAFYQKIHSK